MVIAPRCRRYATTPRLVMVGLGRLCPQHRSEGRPSEMAELTSENRTDLSRDVLCLTFKDSVMSARSRRTAHSRA
jgi:hypothetical protein